MLSCPTSPHDEGSETSSVAERYVAMGWLTCGKGRLKHTTKLTKLLSARPNLANAPFPLCMRSWVEILD